MNLNWLNYNRLSSWAALLLWHDVVAIHHHDGRVYLRHVIWSAGKPYYRMSTTNLWRLRDGGGVSGPSFIRGWSMIKSRRGIREWR